MARTIIGIDPGETGAITLIEGSKVDLCSIDQLTNIVTAFKPVDPCFIVEKVKASPQMGVVSAFTFGEGVGFIRGLLYWSDNKEFVRPQVWQTAVNCLTGGNKALSVKRVKELFPDLKGVNQKNADSVLIAYYGYMKYGRS